METGNRSTIQYRFRHQRREKKWEKISFSGPYIYAYEVQLAIMKQKRFIPDGKTGKTGCRLLIANSTEEKYYNERDIINKNEFLIVSKVPRKKYASLTNRQEEKIVQQEEKIVASSPMVKSTLETQGSKLPIARSNPATHSPKLVVHKKRKRLSTQQLDQEEKYQSPLDPLKRQLLCFLCGKYLQDAVTLPCCFTRFCNECIRQHLVNSDLACPVCDSSDITLKSLQIPPYLQKKVDQLCSFRGW